MRPEEFDRKYCEKLNSQQLEAVHSVDGPVLLLAVPGSGKTTVLVQRLGYMVLCGNIDPRSILTMTYTVAATVEMRQRFAAQFGETCARDMEFCTINALSTRIINYYARFHSRNEPPRLVENDEAIRIIARLYQEINGDYATESIIKDVRTGITYIKNMMLPDEKLDELDLGVENMGKLYRAYSKTLRQGGLMDFDDQLSYALTILRRYGEVLEHFQNRFPYICVDESQDTSKIQHEIIRLLAAKYGNIFMVGDEDQSIYGFRAAYPEALLNFEANYPGAKILLMEKNYRSSREIVSAADVFIAKNEQRHPKNLQAVRHGAGQIRLVEAESRSVQYDYLFEVGRQCREETAILYRNNDSALPLIDMFERRGVKYSCKKFEDSFFTHRVLADFRDIVALASSPADADIFMRVYYKLGFPLSRSIAELACRDCAASGKGIVFELCRSPELSGAAKETFIDILDVLDAIPAMSAAEAVNAVWKRLKYNSYAAKNGLDAGKFEILSELARRETSAAELLRRLDELQEICCSHVNDAESRLILSTVHSSKGLEYERVYLMDMFDGILPSKRRNECREDEDFCRYEEDRRIFYVAMTRAKDELYMFRCPDRAGEFIAELAPRIPNYTVDDDDIFAPMNADFCGKSFSHKEKGKGIIKAQCGDRLLLYYRGCEPELSSLAELMAQRDIKPVYAGGKKSDAAPAPAVQDKIAVGIGTKLRHKKFGAGVVLSVNNGIAKIMFPDGHGVKSIVLATGFRNGIIMPE